MARDEVGAFTWLGHDGAGRRWQDVRWTRSRNERSRRASRMRGRKEGRGAMEKIKVAVEEAPRFSLVLEVAPSSPEDAYEHFRSKLQFETDPADVYADLQKDPVPFVIVDARSPDAFEQEHIPGAINIPHRRMSAKATAR